MELLFLNMTEGVKVYVSFYKITKLLKVEREFSSCDKKFLRDF